MPRKKQTRRRSRRWAGVVIAVLFVGAGLVAFAVAKEMQNSSNDCADGDANCESAETAQDSEDEQSGSGCSLCDKDENQTASTIESEKDFAREELPTGNELSVWVTTKSIVGGKLQIRVQIDQAISSGTCDLAIGTYSASASVMPQPQGASCEGFDVSTDQYSGNSFTITVRSDDKTGVVTGAINE